MILVVHLNYVGSNTIIFRFARLTRTPIKRPFRDIPTARILVASAAAFNKQYLFGASLRFVLSSKSDSPLAFYPYSFRWRDGECLTYLDDNSSRDGDSDNEGRHPRSHLFSLLLGSSELKKSFFRNVSLGSLFDLLMSAPVSVAYSVVACSFWSWTPASPFLPFPGTPSDLPTLWLTGRCNNCERLRQ